MSIASSPGYALCVWNGTKLLFTVGSDCFTPVPSMAMFHIRFFRLVISPHFMSADSLGYQGKRHYTSDCGGTFHVELWGRFFYFEPSFQVEAKDFENLVLDV